MGKCGAMHASTGTIDQTVKEAEKSKVHEQKKRLGNAYGKVNPELAALVHKSVQDADMKTLRSLVVDSHVNPDLPDKKGSTPLIRAIKGGKLEAAELLIVNNANLMAATNEGNTSLHKAVKHNRTTAVEFLLKSKAGVDVQNKGGATPLMLAVMHRSPNSATILIGGKADVNISKDVGYTALMLAARLGNTGMCRLLVKAHADMEITDQYGETALTKADKYHRNEVMSFLRDEGAKEVAAKPHRHHNHKH